MPEQTLKIELGEWIDTPTGQVKYRLYKTGAGRFAVSCSLWRKGRQPFSMLPRYFKTEQAQHDWVDDDLRAKWAAKV